MTIRKFRSVLLILPALLCFGAPSVFGQENPAGAGYLADPIHSGVFPSSLPKRVTPDATPEARTFKKKWAFQTRGKVRSTPFVTEALVFFGSEDGNFYALQKESGLLKWKFDTGSPLTSSPAVSNGIVYFSDNENRIYALNANTGKQVWKYQTGTTLPFISKSGAPATWDYYNCSPTVTGGRVYCGSGDGHMYALDAGSGKLIWKFKTEGRTRSTPAVWEGTVYFGSYDACLYAVDAASGQLKWKHRSIGNDSFRGEIQFPPCIHGGMAFFGARDGLAYGLDARTGERKWAVVRGGWVTSSAASDGVVYFGTSDAFRLIALEAATGKVKWEHTDQGRFFASPALAGNAVVLGIQNGYLIVLDRESAKPVMGGFTEASINSSPVMVDGVLYIGSDDSCLYAFE